MVSACCSLCVQAFPPALALVIFFHQTTLLVVLSAIQVKYTDIDYEVFTDAAKLVAEGSSPFQRSTYRYSPLLAFALLPNVLLFRDCGKLLFSAAGAPPLPMCIPRRGLFCSHEEWPVKGIFLKKRRNLCDASHPRFLDSSSRQHLPAMWPGPVQTCSSATN